MRRAVIVILSVAWALAACGGGPSGNGSPVPGGSSGLVQSLAAGPAGTESDLEAAARAHFQAFKDDDDTAYFAGLTEACRTRAGFGAVAAQINSRHGAISRAGMDLAAISITAVTIDGFDGRTATVALDLAGTNGNAFVEGQPNAWAHEEDGWRWANCDLFAAAGGPGTGGSGPEDAIAVGMIATISGWLLSSTYIQPNANDLVMEGGNPEPPAGATYFLWQIRATYNGPEASVALADDLSFRFVAGDTSYETSSACGPHPGALDLAFVGGPGDGVLGDVCHAVADADAAALFLVVTEKATGTDFWFSQTE